MCCGVPIPQHYRAGLATGCSGPDGLLTRLCRTFCNRLSVKLFPLILKIVSLACEPIGRKGGMLFHLLTPGGDPTRCAGSRGVLSQNASANAAQKVTWGLLVERLDARGQAFRIGGRKGYCVGMSAGAMFVDIIAAVYCVVRELVHGTCGRDFNLHDVVAAVGMDEPDRQLRTLISSRCWRMTFTVRRGRSCTATFT